MSIQNVEFEPQKTSLKSGTAEATPPFLKEIVRDYLKVQHEIRYKTSRIYEF